MEGNMTEERFNTDGQFRHIKNFTQLSGWKRQRVLVGDKPHLLECQSLELTAIKHNWPSQWHSKYPGGYITFDSGKKFDRFRQTTDGKPVFLFRFNESTEVFYERFTLERRILAHLEGLSERDAGALKHLIVELGGVQGFSADFIPFIPSSSIWNYLMRLSVVQLQDLDALLSIPSMRVF